MSSWMVARFRAHGRVAHEVLHTTHSMLEYRDHRLTPDDHEPHALLAEYLTDFVYTHLLAAKFKIKP